MRWKLPPGGSYSEWRSKFALFPRVINDTVVWLERYEWRISSINVYDVDYEYRLKEKAKKELDLTW